jgi:hypothetical protein
VRRVVKSAPDNQACHDAYNLVNTVAGIARIIALPQLVEDIGTYETAGECMAHLLVSESAFRPCNFSLAAGAAFRSGCVSGECFADTVA